MTAKESRCVIKRHAFGVRSEVRDCLAYLDDDTLLYPVGKTVVLHHLPTNTQRFLEASYQSTGLTAIAVSANRKFVAVAEGGEQAHIHIIDTVTRKRRKVLSVPDLGSDRFTSLSFSADGRHLVTQGGAPSWNMYYWNWERSKPLAMVSLAGVTTATAVDTNGSSSGPAIGQDARGSNQYAGASIKKDGANAAAWRAALISRVAISPGDSLVVTVSGVGLLRYYRYTDGVLQPQPSPGIPSERHEVFLTHAWIDADRVVASTQNGGLVLVDHGHYSTTLPVANVASTSYAAATPPVVTVIAPTEVGFVTGTDQGGLNVYEKQQQQQNDEVSAGDAGGRYHLVATLQVPEREPGQPAGASGTAASTVGGGGGGGGADGALTGEDTVTIAAAAAAAAAAATSTAEHEASITTSQANNSSITAVTEEARRRLTRMASQAPTDASSSSTAAVARNPLFEAAIRGSSLGSQMVAPLSASGTRPLTGNVGGVAGSGSGLRPFGDGLGRRGSSGTGGGKLPFGIASLVVDQGQETAALVTNAGRLYGLAFSQDWTKVREGALPTPAFSPLCQPFHTGRINGMGCSVRKPFLITSGSDHSVRVWNTQTNKLEICEFFPQEPGPVAIHPSGLMAIICFSDKVRVMSVLWNSLHNRRALNVRGVTDVKFAQGGQFFAAVHGNIIDVFNSATCELCGQMRGHPQRISDFQWCSTSPYPTDNRMVSCSPDGMIIDWNMAELRKEIEHVEKRCQFSAIASDDRHVWAVATPSSATALEVTWKALLREMDRHNLGTTNATAAAEFEFTETALTALTVAPHQRMLFGGGGDGSLKPMMFPLQAGMQEAPVTAHATAVTRMVLSFDEATLFTASSDGSVFIWDVREDGRRKPAAGAGTGQTSGGAGSTFLTDEVLVTQQSMEERRLEVECLQQQVERLKTDIESEEKRRSHEQGTRMRERTEEYKAELASLAAEFANLWNAKSEQERAFVAIKVDKEADAAHATEQLERTKQTEVQTLEETCAALKDALERLKTDQDVALKELADVIAQESHEDAEHFRDVLQQRQEQRERLERQVERSRQTNEEALHQLELDTDLEVETICGKHQTELDTLREKFLRMKGEGAVMRKNGTRMEKEIEVRAGEILLLDSAKAALLAELGDLSQQMAQLHQDIDERDAVIGEKEKAIYALKRQSQELEKCKFVLDHRIRQLKAQMEPKQREIVQQHQRISQKNTELERLHESNLTLRANIEELKNDLVEQQQQIKQMLNRIKDFETYRGRFHKDVGEMAAALQEPTELRALVTRLFQAHVVARGGERIAQADPQIKHEFTTQLEFLSTSVDALRRKVKADQERHKKEVSAMMVENLALIREIHDLREEIQGLRNHIAAEDATRRAHGGGGGSKRGYGEGTEDSWAGMETEGESRATPATARSHAMPFLANSYTNNGGASAGGKHAATASSASASYLVGGGSRRGGGGGRRGVPTARRGRGGGAAPRRASANTATAADAAVGTSLGTTTEVAGDPAAPPKPAALETNRNEIRMQRAYIELLERTLASAQLSSSTRPRTTPQLPPLMQ